ncbi:hypothetical protein L228DRAFT_238268 [Xylona heveae TC161]|uniref:tRNA (guanine(37)-N1)-methyltransferase n=1 Tax=Xylona heveae (strain CBS 132557 / TC161) TaxID=1328760 RepID=A0A161TD44_XYLHT|nr:hypothetical protein L228DRAFT_238268 [Xylona heveae TC161]KZF23747.1 hypothetical protein L228DRAFT_238268 [Xylona heveae TC161]
MSAPPEKKQKPEQPDSQTATSPSETIQKKSTETFDGTAEKSTREVPREEMFRPPINRAMRVLDRPFFRKTVPLSAARVLENRNIAKCRSALEKSREALQLDRITIIRPDPEPEIAAQGKKCLLLEPEVRHNDASTWGPVLTELAQAESVRVIPYNLELEYEYWTYHDIMTSILPEDEQDELPTGFSIVGHVAHLNLRPAYLPYKHLIASVLVDKNPSVRTVINKTDDVGTVSEYRTFSYELLAGDPSLDVVVKEGDCTFHFDYSAVYWNSRLNTEHRRLVESFAPGSAVCDVMAGVGPFAVPAGKRGVFVWANDLNPASYASLSDAIARNKVSPYVRAFCGDGMEFIRSSAQQLLQAAQDPQSDVVIMSKPPRRSELKAASAASSAGSAGSKANAGSGTGPVVPQPPKEIKRIKLPRTFQHYVMNLPATATSFLPAFIGVYAGHEDLFEPDPSSSSSSPLSSTSGAAAAATSGAAAADAATAPSTAQLPMIHVHCFSTKSDDNQDAYVKIAAELSAQLGHAFVAPKGRVLEGGASPVSERDELVIHDVRDVAPQKRMFCASFRLPREVAFRKV